jgi:hypothetical protein
MKSFFNAAETAAVRGHAMLSANSPTVIRER